MSIRSPYSDRMCTSTSPALCAHVFSLCASPRGHAPAPIHVHRSGSWSILWCAAGRNAERAAPRPFAFAYFEIRLFSRSVHERVSAQVGDTHTACSQALRATHGARRLSGASRVRNAPGCSAEQGTHLQRARVAASLYIAIYSCTVAISLCTHENNIYTRAPALPACTAQPARPPHLASPPCCRRCSHANALLSAAFLNPRRTAPSSARTARPVPPHVCLPPD
ncbi:hypothetical protein HYPSUDRAFT_908707 [Hypholoma sublateritium FD-334 SS-4]|uniref:Uncharacterized protein n=1 Tax=Hypholoma sublateritium (strain FD-334 SS-4) TaxID=945553 RepID=A0A0D2KWH3_HYPSF|nr:hypothetical protein HYPSUDRAFT_908707 [Hypholoma sublateritium FD-334 SS-4]